MTLFKFSFLNKKIQKKFVSTNFLLMYYRSILAHFNPKSHFISLEKNEKKPFNWFTVQIKWPVSMRNANTGLKWVKKTHREKAPSNGTKYSRMEQVNFVEDKCFKGCLPQILLDPFLNTLTQMKLQCLWTVWICTFGSVVHQINSL